MEFQAEWLLVLPLFFFLGWVSAQWDSRKRALESKQLPKSYFKGLHHLLDQEPDKAIDALIDVARVDTATVDLYFALGHLFCQRGEIERGIRVYQSLIERPDLTPSARMAATFKLGETFLSGGLFDRAEACFIELLTTEYKIQAREKLLHIYQSQQEWQQAIAMARQINQEPKTQGQQSLAIAHFYCELAQIALREKQWAQAQNHLAAARDAHPKTIRPQIMQGQLLAAQDQHLEALQTWKALAQSHPEAVPLMIQAVTQSASAIGRIDESMARIYEHALATGSIDVVNAWLTMQQAHGDPEQTEPKLSAIFTRHPSLNALNQLLNIRIAHTAQEEQATTASEAAQEGALIRGLIQKQVKELSRYRCTHCGFEAHRYYWQCPACTRWETYPPKRLEELQWVARSRADTNSYY